MKKKIGVLGITGSIGDSVIEIVKYHSEAFEIVFATAHSNYQKLFDISKQMKINKVALTSQEIPFGYFSKQHDAYPVTVLRGESEIINLIQNEDYDILINAVSGSAGLSYTIAALMKGRDIALANKESLVMAGHLIRDIIAKTGAKILPIDSEHSAIFQVLHGHCMSEVKKLHLTASGGPFRLLPIEDFRKIELKDVLMHPIWSMGNKVTIDSATMMNKALEVIEAHWLFNINYENINAIIHPQSVIHSLVEFVDGSIVAQMSVPTMQLPILYALTYPMHYTSDKINTSLEALPALTFEPICKKRYPLFFLALNAGKDGGIMPVVLNAANEVAQDMFIRGEISFMDIYNIVDDALNRYENISNPDLETILKINNEITKGK